MNLPDRENRKGQPLLVLSLILLSWIGIRSILWVSSTAQGSAESNSAMPKATRPAVPTPLRGLEPRAGNMRHAWPARDEPPARPMIVVPLDRDSDLPARPTTVPPKIAAGHRLLFLDGVSAIPAPPTERAAEVPVGYAMPLAQPSLREKMTSRWSGDAWVLWRQGGNGYGQAGGSPPAIHYPRIYGASQAGFVLRYRLMSDDPHRTAAYLRASGGIDRPRGEELAAGVALRPVGRVPIAILGEVRAMRAGSATVTRPTVAMVSEFPVVALPLGLRGEVYGQAGWVGGRGHTPFVDAQARIDKRLVAERHADLSIGAGAWGGAQTGSSRLDIGPSLRLDLPLGGANARITADYRWRVAGSAVPGSGAAITFSAGF